MSKEIDKDYERLSKRVSLTSADWDSLIQDLQEGIPTAVLLVKYSIPKHYLKLVKRYYISVN